MPSCGIRHPTGAVMSIWSAALSVSTVIGLVAFLSAVLTYIDRRREHKQLDGLTHEQRFVLEMEEIRARRTRFFLIVMFVLVCVVLVIMHA
jgi:hypothetical protein